MACDNCPWKYYKSTPCHCTLDLATRKKLFRRNLYSNNVMILYIALLHVCLFVNCEALGENEAPKRSYLTLSDAKLDAVIPPTENLDVRPTSPFDSVRERSSSTNASLKHLVKRQAPEETVNPKGDPKKAADDSLPPSASNKSANDDSESVIQESKQLDSEVVDDPPAVNTTPKIKVSNESSVTGQATEDSEDDELGLGPPSGLKPDAILRLFYVLLCRSCCTYIHSHQIFKV
ncbi:uncharacterized protein LOC135226395 [Macrobrachium nipponense]|uniref:uncharacterized protein LOC135226395 n=1 Tax=Macrobrachium nipponense TaxID=159736 RepID=UPI0030C8C865